MQHKIFNFKEWNGNNRYNAYQLLLDIHTILLQNHLKFFVLNAKMSSILIKNNFRNLKYCLNVT